MMLHVIIATMLLTETRTVGIVNRGNKKQKIETLVHRKKFRLFMKFQNITTSSAQLRFFATQFD